MYIPQKYITCQDWIKKSLWSRFHNCVGPTRPTGDNGTVNYSIINANNNNQHLSTNREFNSYLQLWNFQAFTNPVTETVIFQQSAMMTNFLYPGPGSHSLLT